MSSSEVVLRKRVPTTPLKIRFILDSGAFSAWTRQVSINIDEYIAYVQRNAHLCYAYINLDVIPGQFGRVPTLGEVEVSANQGWENLLYMESKGLRPMPVFHQGEQFKWLHRMMDHGCDYIGISPANDRTTEQKRVWLDQVFDVICDDDGEAKVRTHGFGVTSIALMARYPWHTADSTSWKLFGVYGMILVPVWRNGEFRYDVPPQSVFVSSKSRALQEEGKHFETYSPTVQKHILEYLAECQVTYAMVKEDSSARLRVNAHFYARVNAWFAEHPPKFKRSRRGLL